MSKTASHKELDSTTKRNSSIVRYDIDFFALHNGINSFLSDVFNLSQLSEIPKTSIIDFRYTNQTLLQRADPFERAHINNTNLK